MAQISRHTTQLREMRIALPHSEVSNYARGCANDDGQDRPTGRRRTRRPRHIRQDEMPALGDQVRPLSSRDSAARGHEVSLLAGPFAVLNQRRFRIACLRCCIPRDPQDVTLAEMRLGPRARGAGGRRRRYGDRTSECGSGRDHDQSSGASVHWHNNGTPPLEHEASALAVVEGRCPVHDRTNSLVAGVLPLGGVAAAYVAPSAGVAAKNSSAGICTGLCFCLRPASLVGARSTSTRCSR